MDIDQHHSCNKLYKTTHTHEAVTL